MSEQDPVVPPSGPALSPRNERLLLWGLVAVLFVGMLAFGAMTLGLSRRVAETERRVTLMSSGWQGGGSGGGGGARTQRGERGERGGRTGEGDGERKHGGRGQELQAQSERFLTENVTDAAKVEAVRGAMEELRAAIEAIRADPAADRTARHTQKNAILREIDACAMKINGVLGPELGTRYQSEVLSTVAGGGWRKGEQDEQGGDDDE
ncbi:MAG: hypothetical protein ABIO70_29990 [Pseudomonadota bacterium]